MEQHAFLAKGDVLLKYFEKWPSFLRTVIIYLSWGVIITHEKQNFEKERKEYFINKANMPTVFPLHAAFKKLFSLTKTLIPLNVFGNDENLLENAEHTLVKTAHSLTGAWLSLKKATLSPNYFRNYENLLEKAESSLMKTTYTLTNAMLSLMKTEL